MHTSPWYSSRSLLLVDADRRSGAGVPVRPREPFVGDDRRHHDVGGGVLDLPLVIAVQRDLLGDAGGVHDGGVGVRRA
jgi:hypothetical protein